VVDRQPLAALDPRERSELLGVEAVEFFVMHESLEA
jgi:hypothetical protein